MQPAVLRRQHDRVVERLVGGDARCHLDILVTARAALHILDRRQQVLGEHVVAVAAIVLQAQYASIASRVSKISCTSCAVRPRYEAAAARHRLHQPLVGELLQRVDDRGAADPELQRDRVDRDLLAVISVVFAWMRPDFADPGNVNKILHAASISAIMFLGATWVIACGACSTACWSAISGCRR